MRSRVTAHSPTPDALTALNLASAGKLGPHASGLSIGWDYRHKGVNKGWREAAGLSDRQQELANGETNLPFLHDPLIYTSGGSLSLTALGIPPRGMEIRQARWKSLSIES